MKISLIIPAYNEENYIGTCLRYALENTNKYIDEIVVVDNASSDKTYEIALDYVEKYPIIKIIKEYKRWPNSARQRWYLESTWDILVFIDADTKAPKWWIENFKNEFLSDLNIGFISGWYYFYDITFYQQIVNYLYWWIIAYPSYLIVGYLGVWGNFAIKRDILQKMNGFDTDIEFYGDDTDIARRASQYCKTKFLLHNMMPTSARRFVWQGVIKTITMYIINFLSQVIAHKSVSKKYKDFR